MAEEPQSKRRYYPVHNFIGRKAGEDSLLVEVSEEVFRVLYKDIWNAQNKARKKGLCAATWHMRTKYCDGDCIGCKYYKGNADIKGDEEVMEGITRFDMISSDNESPEDVFMKKELLMSLLRELEELSEDDQVVLRAFMNSKTDTAAAEMLGIPRQTFQSRKQASLKRLEKKMKKYV